MATGKRYYWIKLKESFMTSDAVDFLMGQKDGANYVVLYQMLCLKTINTDGKLERHIGEVIIPYNEDKIQRDTKWFSLDTVRVALNLYKALGLVYQDNSGCLTIANYNNLVGSETDYAERNRRLRANQNSALPVHNVYSDVSENVSTEIDIDIRDRDKEIEKEKDTVSSKKSTLSDGDKKETASDEPVCRTKDVRRVVDAWNGLGLQKVTKILPDSVRGNMLRKRIKDYGIDAVITAIGKISGSDFLTGNNDRGWTITFDWFIKPNNFPKVLEGNYDNHKTKTAADPPVRRNNPDDTERLKRILGIQKERDEK